MERVAALAGLLLLAGGLAACGPRVEPQQGADGASAALLMSSQAAAGFERALEPRRFEFPADHGPHPGFQTEWWFVTGHLRDGGGAEYGYQVTFFRRALRPPGEPSRESAWHSDAIWMAHAALLEVGPARFRAHERFEREALDLAGAGGAPLRVWVADWSLQGPGADLFPMRLRAQDEDFALDLELSADKPFVLHGEEGLSHKGSAPGNASYYYSATRLATRGTLRVAGATRDVEGSSWLDREWSTSALEADQEGWDWFALQLDDGRELMLYQLRDRGGSSAASSAGTLVARDGNSRALRRDDFSIEVLERWTSPASGVRYPARWRLRVPGQRLDLELEPLAADAELRLALRYWEGPVAVRGTGPDGPLSGRGYVELVGYGDGPSAGD